MHIVHFIITACLFACDGRLKHTDSASALRTSSVLRFGLDSQWRLDGYLVPRCNADGSNPKLDETAQSYLRSTPRNSDLFIGIFFITSPTNGNGNNGNQKKKPDADRERKKKTG